ncbi:MAG: hypothetical protein ABIB98_03960 [bacterium]
MSKKFDYGRLILTILKGVVVTIGVLFIALVIFMLISEFSGEAGRSRKEYRTPWKYGEIVTEDTILVTVVEKHWEGESIESYDFALLVVRENNGKSGIVYVGRDEFAHIQRGDEIYVKIP